MTGIGGKRDEGSAQLTFFENERKKRRQAGQ